MTYLLDRNAISDLMRTSPRMERWLAELSRLDRLVTCPTVRGEVFYGIARLPEGRRRSDLSSAAGVAFLRISCVPTPCSAAEIYASIKLMRQQSGRSMDENDLWIAATALALGATLVSRDLDLQGLEGLAVLAL
jgi:predicted nucleic acid-binding protein